MSKVRIHITVTILIMAFIFIQSALPGDLSGAESNVLVELITRIFKIDSETLSFIVRKIAHFTEYLILGVFLALDARDFAGRRRDPAYGMGQGLRQRSEHGPWQESAASATVSLWLIAYLIGTLYAVTDEFHQSFVPGRSCELRDMMIDSAGVAAGALVLLLMKKK